MEVMNASLVDNSANGGAGLYLLRANVGLVNVTMSGGTFRHEGGAIVVVQGPPPLVSFSNFFGNAAPEFVGMITPVGTEGNIAVDPTFVQKYESEPPPGTCVWSLGRPSSTRGFQGCPTLTVHAATSGPTAGPAPLREACLGSASLKRPRTGSGLISNMFATFRSSGVQP